MDELKVSKENVNSMDFDPTTQWEKLLSLKSKFQKNT